MRVLVCGSRTWSDPATIHAVLFGLSAMQRDDGSEGDPEFVVITGGAAGADRQATVWAQTWDRRWAVYLADWSEHGKAAGPIRNQRMLDEGTPDVVWAFVDKPLAESKGTADMCRRAKAAGLPVYVVSPP